MPYRHPTLAHRIVVLLLTALIAVFVIATIFVCFLVVWPCVLVVNGVGAIRHVYRHLTIPPYDPYDVVTQRWIIVSRTDRQADAGHH